MEWKLNEQLNLVNDENNGNAMNIVMNLQIPSDRKPLTPEEMKTQKQLTKHIDLPSILSNKLSIEATDDAFYVLEVDDVIRKHMHWCNQLPRVQPYYAVKCNPSPAMLELLSGLGLSFDCASKAEIDMVLALGNKPDRIIYANPCKTRSFIKHAKQMQVDLMTFDGENELYKIAELHPQAQLVLRIKVDDSQSVCKFSAKFGADLSRCELLLRTARNLNLNLVGVSFHVGSGCESAKSFGDAIANAKCIFNMAADFGYDMSLLDLGGGWPGTSDVKISFEEIAAVVNQSLSRHFPAGCGVKIIAEPGRYYAASAFSLATQIIAKKINEDGVMMYYLNDGVYGSFNCTIFDHWDVTPEPLTIRGVQQKLPEKKPCFGAKSNFGAQNCFQTTLWGPTCDSMDCIKKDVQLPEMAVGDWMLFREMGAYTMAAASTFNGFAIPNICYLMSNTAYTLISHLPAWPRILATIRLSHDDNEPLEPQVPMKEVNGVITVH